MMGRHHWYRNMQQRGYIGMNINVTHRWAKWSHRELWHKMSLSPAIKAQMFLNASLSLSRWYMKWINFHVFRGWCWRMLNRCVDGNPCSQAFKCWATHMDRWMRFSKPKLSSKIACREGDSSCRYAVIRAVLFHPLLSHRIFALF